MSMNTGARFWQLVGVVVLILGGYALAELHDAVQAKQKQLESQQQLLFRQQALLRDNRWIENRQEIERIQREWLAYLPVEESATVAKAHLLSQIRTVAQQAGIQNLNVTATDAEGGQPATSAGATGTARTNSVSRPGDAKPKADQLPAGVQVIKLRVAGHFQPTAFVKLLLALEQEQQFAIIERLTVRGTQLEVGIRCYRRFNAGPANLKANSPSAPITS